MNYIGKFISNFKEFYNEINSATLTGAIDVIVIQQPDGTYFCSPFHVRFGKIGVLHSREKVVDIEINGHPANIHMKLGESGEAFFVEEVKDENEIPQYLATSPLPTVPDIGEELRKLRFTKEIYKNDVNSPTSPTKTNNLPLGRGMSEVTLDTKAMSFLQNGSDGMTSSPGSSFEPQNRVFLKTSDEEVEGITRRMDDKSEDEFNNNPATTALPDQSNIASSDAQDESRAKRRKKKRPSAKKRGKSREMSIPPSEKKERNSDSAAATLSNNNEQERSAEKPEEMFQMDDDYGDSEEDEGYPCGTAKSGANGAGNSANAGLGLSRSVSLPLNGKLALCGGEWPSRKMSSTFTGEFHPFSDGDVTPQSSPTGSRPPSPKSDTEYEIAKHEALIQGPAQPTWGWGQLPNVPTRRTSSSQMEDPERSDQALDAQGGSKAVDSDEAEKRSMLGGMLNFMRSTKKMRHMPESEGIYLDSINTNSLDPEVAALYFPKFRSTCFLPQEGALASSPSAKDEDAESGKGPSLPHSPHSVEGAIGGPCGRTECDFEDRHHHSLCDCENDVAMSLCGGLLDAEAEFPEETFMNSLVTYDAFTENPSILLDPNLVIRVAGKFYNWQTAAPILLSMMVFQKSLPEKTTNQLVNEHMPKKKKSKASSWWSWRRSEAGRKVETTATESAQTSTESDGTDSCSNNTSTAANNGLVAQSTAASELPGPEATDAERPTSASELFPEERKAADSGRPTEVRLTRPSSGTPSDCSSLGSPVPSTPGQLKEELTVPVASDDTKESSSNCEGEKRPEKYKKSLRLTSEQITSLNLVDGPNEVVFSVTTAYQGTTRCKCDIYLWSYDDKIVISDIDGTITKSDVLGHILPMVGRDWAQLGVAQLFTKVQGNGYQFLYLSARAIGQARITRDYIRSLRQGEVCLPDGPLLLSPTSLISALHREVIEKKPEEFKISCLKDIQTLFPQYMGNPFYAGFGNKINDTWAYRAVGIPTTRVFTINHKGELKLELIQTFQSSYSGLSDQVDHMFPPLNPSQRINGRLAPSFTSSEEFSYFTYWRDPIRSLAEEEDDDDFSPA